MNDIWEGTAKNIYEFFHNQDNKKLLEKILAFMNLKFKEEIVGWVFSWKKMCITGSFENYSREQLVAILEKNGWAFVSSVSAKTDYLLAWEKAWSKLKKATELWVEVLNIEEFFEKIAN
jgi:DNA ligase (NAD+)